MSKKIDFWSAGELTFMIFFLFPFHFWYYFSMINEGAYFDTLEDFEKSLKKDWLESGYGGRAASL